MGRGTKVGSSPTSTQYQHAPPPGEETDRAKGTMAQRDVEWVEVDAKSIPIDSKGEGSSLHRRALAAGRGVVKICNSSHVEKQMTKWEVINYARLLEHPQNAHLAEYLPKEVLWRSSSTKTYNLVDKPLPDNEFMLLDVTDSKYEFPVKMTNVSPSGTALDVKLSDLICYEGDLLHGKDSWRRYAKSFWHRYKQKTNKSAVTIQTTSKKIGRELSELKQDRNFVTQLLDKADFSDLYDVGDAPDIKEMKLTSKIEAMINQLKGLREAVKKSSVGFVGSSVLLSFADSDQMVTLIDLENCIMPEDIGARSKINQKLIETQRNNFVRGINTLIEHLSGLTIDM